MAKAIEQKGHLTVGHAALGFRGDVSGSVRQEVHDGDTINVCAAGNFGVRFLGVDAPEISYTLPDGGGSFRSLGDSRWEAFLSDPLSGWSQEPDLVLTAGLRAHLQACVGPGAATNHYRHAKAAEDALEEEVEHDMAVLGQSEKDFRFFLAFAHEVVDVYGRFLCFINRDQPRENDPEPRPRSYNERLLEKALVSPYFIWPNTDPFRRQASVSAAVVPPGGARDMADRPGALRDARQWVRGARQGQKGLFDAQDPLRLQPFEIRFLSGRRPPSRWVIDLGKNDDVLIRPQNYYTIANVEDRLYIPDQYVPLFVEKGWRRQAPP